MMKNFYHPANGLRFSAQITIFYIIFYSLLAAFWIACLAVFLNTLDDKVPRFYGKGTIIGVNPGAFAFHVLSFSLSFSLSPSLTTPSYLRVLVAPDLLAISFCVPRVLLERHSEKNSSKQSDDASERIEPGAVVCAFFWVCGFRYAC